MRAAWPRILPFALLMLLLALGPMLVKAMPAWADWLYALRTLVVLLALLWVWPRLPELQVAGAGWPRQDIWLAGLAGFVAFLLWITLGPLLGLGLGGASGAPPPVEGSPGRLLWISFRVLGACLVVPVVEELFWRAYLMRRLDRADFIGLMPGQVSLFAVLASSAVFALAHRELLAAFLCGLIYAGLYRRTGKLWMAILAHALTNACLATYVLYTGKYDFW